MFNSLINRIKGRFSKRDKGLPPQDFFQQIKDKQQRITLQMLVAVKASLADEIKQFLDNGQVESAARLLFHLNCINREQAVIDSGLTTYVYRDDLDVFITSVSKNVVKIIDLAHYERKIPKEQSEQIQKVKDLFDEVYIVFTDYTGVEERKVAHKDRAKDPIAFGAFKSKDNKIWNHRFYYICDWTDDYCDLTLDKFVAEMMEANYLEPVHTAADITIEELEQRIAAAKQDVNKEQETHWSTLVTLAPRDDHE